MSSANRGSRYYSAAAFLFILVFFLQSFFSSFQKSVTSDEPSHIAGALSYIAKRQVRVNPQHPPLLKELSGLSMLAGGIRWPEGPEADALFAGDQRYEPGVGGIAIGKYGPAKVMFWARLPFILVSTLLVALIYLWGRQMLGAPAALSAVFLCAFDPTILAHSNLVTTDCGLAAFSILFLYTLWNYLVKPPSRTRLLWCGLALGAALTAKFSAVVLIPVGGALLLAGAVRAALSERPAAPAKPGRNEPCPCGSGKLYKRCHEGKADPIWPAVSRILRAVLKAGISAAAAMAVMLLLAIGVIFVVYFFENPALYIAGLRRVNADHKPDYLVYMAGQVQRRFDSYFAVAYLLKEPVATIVLAAIGLFALMRKGAATAVDRLFLLLPMAAFFAGYSRYSDNLGIRYIIPALPFAYLIGGLGLASLFGSGVPWRRILGGALGVWLVLAAAAIYPDHIPYFNETACLLEEPRRTGLDGGTRCGPLWLDDSNVDWGQGFLQLKQWLDRNAKGRPVKFAYFSSVPPAIYGIACERLSEEQLLGEPSPGLYVVSAHLVAALPVLAEHLKAPGGAWWLRRIEPAAIVGHSLYVYDIPAR